MSAPYLIKILALCLFSVLASSCVNVSSERGVENRWGQDDADTSTPRWTKGKTTKGEILHDLGPPSQVVSLGDETVFYYLRENITGRGVVTLVYNDIRVKTSYDRAIFFFDKRGRLVDMATSETQ